MIDPNERIRRVELTEYNPEWPKVFADAANEIKSILKENCVQIHHIGSTAIPNIYAKPIVDMLPVVKDISLVDSLKHEFEKLGYLCMGEYGISGRRFYWKSKTKRTHHIHLFEQGSPEIKRHLLFRDFIIAYKDYAQNYSLVKQSLAEVFSEDIENYVNGKNSFIQMIDYKTGSAKAEQLEAKDNIIIEPYNSNWPKLAEAEIKAIKGVSSQLSYVSIEHYSSDKMEHRILFRDILRRDQKIRLEYEALKIKLSESNSADREAYTDKKGEFIKNVLRERGYLKPIFR